MKKVKKVNSKIVSLIVLGLLTVSAIAFRQEAGQVLGVTEKIETSGNSGIGSGAATIKTDDIKNTEFTGKALWDKEQIVDIKTDKFDIGQEIIITVDDKDFGYIVNDNRDSLSDETILILNTETFIRLGGNLENSNTIDVKVTSTK